MGTWTLKSIKGSFSDFDTAELFGTNVYVTYQLQYTPSMIDRFVEPPKLEWLETIMMNEHHKNEHWVFQTNMYTHNPMSKTLEIWPKRYIEAYNDVSNAPFSGKGYAKLLSKLGMRLPYGALKSGITNNSKKADEVRNYLKRNGGMLEIQIHDIPSINKPAPTDNTHKERLLNFDCGIVGGGQRYRAQQYLNVVAGQPVQNWERKFQLNWPLGFKSTGLNKVPAPGSVSNPRQAVFFDGEIW
jgi:hypothetical protein